jgi:hypothetical protein
MQSQSPTKKPSEYGDENATGRRFDTTGLIDPSSRVNT